MDKVKTNLDKIRAASRFMAGACWIYFLLAIYNLLYPLFLALRSNDESRFFYVILLPDMSLSDKLIATTPLVMFFLCVLIATCFASRFFGYLFQGEIFATSAINNVKRVGWLLCIGIALYGLSVTVINWFFRHLSEITHLWPHYSLSADLIFLFLPIPLLFFLIAWILEEGRKLKENNPSR